MTLLEYVQTLSSDISVAEKIALTKSWKKKNEPAQETVQQAVVEEEVKINPAVETDAPATGTTDGVSESLSSGDLALNISLNKPDNSILFGWQKDIISPPKEPGVIGKLDIDLSVKPLNEMTRDLKASKKELYGDVDFIPGEIKKGKGNYEYKYEIVENDKKEKTREFFFKGPNDTDWINQSERIKNKPKSDVLQNQMVGILSELGFMSEEAGKNAYKIQKQNEKIRELNKQREEYNEFQEKIDNYWKEKNKNVDINPKSKFEVLKNDNSGGFYNRNKNLKERLEKNSMGMQQEQYTPGYYSDFNYDKESNQSDQVMQEQYYIKDSFGLVDKDSFLAEALGPELTKKFIGYLNKNDLSKDLLNNVLAGNFGVHGVALGKHQNIYDKASEAYDNLSGGGAGFNFQTLQKAEVARQRRLSTYLSNFLLENKQMEDNKILDGYASLNPDKFKGITNIVVKRAKARSLISELSWNEEGFTSFDSLDYEKIGVYLDNFFPQLKAVNDKTEAARTERIAEVQKKGGWNGFLYETMISMEDNVLSRAQQFGHLILSDILNFDTRFSMIQEAEGDAQELGMVKKPFVSGKTSTIAGTEYVLEDGVLYEAETNTPALDQDILVPGTEDKVMDIVKGSNKTTTSFSGSASTTTAAGALTGLAVDIFGTKGIGRATGLLRKVGIRNIVKLPQARLDGMLYWSGLGYAQGKLDTYQQLIAAGRSEKEAGELSDQAAAQTSILYGAAGIFSPTEKYFNAFQKTVNFKQTVKNAVTQFTKPGNKKSWGEIFKSYLPTKAGTFNTVKAAGGEIVEETGQEAVTSLVINENINQQLGVDVLDAEFTTSDLATTVTISMAVSGAATNIKMPGSTNNYSQLNSSLFMMGQNPADTKKSLDNLVKNGEITQQQSSEIMAQVRAIINQSPNIPNFVSPESLLKSSMILQDIADLQNRKKTMDKAFHENIDIKIENKREALAEIVKPELEKSISRKGSKAKAADMDVEFLPFGSQEEIDAKKAEIIAKGGKVIEDVGYGQSLEFEENGVTKKVILINDQVSAEDNVYTTGKHETLHPFWEQALKGNPELAIKFGKSLMLEFLNNKEISGGAKFLSKFQSYVNDDNYSAENTWSEVIPLMSEYLSSGDIQYNPKQEVWYKNIGTKISNFLKNPTNKQPLNLRFNTGKDVFDFIVAYNNSTDAGKGWSAAENKVRLEGAKGALVDDDLEVNNTYIVQEGETIEDVAEKFPDITLKQLKQLNKTGGQDLEVGTELIISAEKNLVSDIDLELSKQTKNKNSESSAKASKRAVESLEQASRNKELVQKAKDGDIIAGQNLVDENSGLILDLLKFNPDVTKDSGVDADALLQAVKDAATPGLANLVFPGRYREESDTKRTGAISLFNEYKESSGEVSTFLGRLKQRQAEIYTAAGLDPNKYNIESLDTAEAKQITNEETEETLEPSNEVSTNQIDVTTFGPAKNKKVALEKIIKIEKGERLNFKTLNNKYFNEVSEEIFGIDGKKVRGNVSLNYGNSKKTDYSEANALQNIFKNSENVRNLVKTMPPYNVATKEATINEQGESIDVSRDTYGRALGINPTVLKTFYQKVNRSIPGISNPKGRSLGKSTQTDVFELKPEFRGNIDNDVITDIQSSVGVNKGELSVPIKGPARTEFGSVLTGLSKMYVDNVINTIGRSKLDSKQAKADLAAGKSKSMASKRIETEADMPSALVTKFQEISILKNKKQLANDLDFSSPPINESNRIAQQEAMQEEVVSFKLDTAAIEAGGMGSGGKQTFYGLKGGKMYSSAKQAFDAGIKNAVKFGKTTDGKFIEITTKGITNWIAKPGKLYYGKSDPAYKKLIESAQVYNGPKTKRITPARAFSENPKTRADAKQEAKDNMEVLDHVVNQLSNAVANGMSLDIAGAIIIQSYQATSGLIKIAAPFKYRSIEMRYGGPNSKKQQREGKKSREEHNPPASVIGAAILLAIKTNAATPVMEAIKENYYQTELSKFDDDLLDQAKLDSTLVKGQSVFNNPITRLAAAGIDLNTLKNPDTGKTIAEESGFGIDPKIYAGYNVNEKVQASNVQNEAILKTIQDPNYKVAKVIKASLPLVKGKSMASKRNSDLIPKAIAYDQSITVQKGINALEKTDKALGNARKLDAPVKKIRVFDFDDTLARSKSMVIVNMPDGSSKKINATQFAQQAADLESQGAEFDFAEFSEVVEGKKGPLFEVAQKIADARGTEDVFILTARPQNADGPIKAFMKANGIDIPLKNITGLGDGTAQAKAGWIMGKAAEGYNDFYFADDAIKNVQAVKDVLGQIDVKSKVQLAKASKRDTFDTIVNDMIEDSSGIETYKQYSAARAQTVGASKGRFNFFIPASAEDFTGLLYKMLGKGKKGDAQMAFLKANLLDPYDRAESAVTQAKIAAANDFKALKQNLKTLPKSLSKPTGIGGFTFSHAVRVAIWSKQGMDIPGLSKKDIKELNDFVDNNTELSVFTDELMKIQKGKPYPKPGKSWLGGNITGDIINDINKVNRAEYQQEWRENVDIIFSEDNMNKMEAAYGSKWRRAMEDSLRRMKSGSNRPPGGNSVTDGLLDWLNNSVGAVMFLNTRSALLQTISAVNFINWGDNNIVKAGIAFANQKQFWSDFMTLMNSDYLVERRNGLKINVSESEIADAVRDSDNKVKAAIAFLLSKGFVMTRFADSFAIATGGSTFYRNRVKTLVGKGMEQKAAEAQAFEDFRQIAEESQQSSNPNRISQQQASGAGRVILAWANTPMQYARIQKRAAQDLINGRGDWKTNVSKIVYYGAVQNLIFNALQQAVFALGFGEDDEEEMDAKKSKKISRIANGMIDSQLKGLGIGGAAVVALKSTLMELGKQYSKDRPKYEEAVFDLLGFSPPLGSKVQKIYGGLRSFSWNMKDIKDKGLSLDNPAYLAGAQITTGLTNIPLDRVIKKLNSMRGIVSEQSSLWQKVALGLGWSTWDVGLGYYGGFDAAKVLTPEEERVKEIDDMKKLTKTQEQIDMLLDLGLTKKEIKALGKEQVRVEKIIELQNAEAKPKEEAKVKKEIKEETKPTPEVKAKPKTESAERRLRRQFDSIKDENKPDQVKTLLKFGLTKKEIRELQYEKNRVNKILELMPKNK